MQSTTLTPHASASHAGQAVPAAGTLAASGIAFFIGLSFVFIVGFSHLDAVHNAAHDTRHSLSFPCH